MKYLFLLLILTGFLAITNAHDMANMKARLAHKRQVGAAAVTTSSVSSSSSTTVLSTATQTSTSNSGSISVSSASTTSTSASASISVPEPAPAVSGIPPLDEITLGMPTPATTPVPSTYKAGAIPPFTGAPPLPTPFVFSPDDWPAQDKVPDTTTEEVAEWMEELDGFHIPDLDPTPDGSCVNDTAAASDAANRGWWTCGGYTRPTDIVACPDKYTWGVSFDDGPSPYTQTLLSFLNQQDLHATFFVVGSRVIERPDVLVEQYMTGHEISVHTWSHRHLTSLTNAEIVAELGWTRKAIKTVLGVTPTTMRPPYGDIDDRVRAISLAMGLVPIIWTRTPAAGQFDTNDWQVAGGLVTGVQSFQTFEAILGNASLIDTGFIVLQHDLFPQTVDLAIGYTLPAAMSHNPTLTLQPIGQCYNIPTSDLYRESNTNETFPYTNVTSGDADISSASTNSTSAASLDRSPALGVSLAAGLSVVGFSLLY